MRERETRPARAGWVRVAPLAQRRERRRHDELVLLLDELTAGVRRPGTGGASLLADPEAVGRILIGPDVDPLVERAELGMTGCGQRRELDATLDLLGPALDNRRRRPGKHRVGADLVEIAMLARRESRAERCGDDDLAFHLDEEFLDFWRPVRDGLAPHPGPVLQIVIRPDVDNLVQWPDFDMKESAERRHLDAF